MINNNQNSKDQQIAQLKAELQAKQLKIATLKTKVSLVKLLTKISLSSILILGVGYTVSIHLHNDVTKTVITK